MTKEHESILEPYLKKICEQNELIINLLKMLSIKETIALNDDSESIIFKMESLTKRERQVIELIVQGKLNKEMAYDLELSLSTIETHRSNVMKKFKAKNVAQLTKDYMTYHSIKKL